MIYTKAHFTDEVTELELDNRKLARRFAREAIVMLKNDGFLPIKKSNIAVYGSGATKTIYGGTGSGEVMGRDYVNIVDGLNNKGFFVSNKSWLSDFEKEFNEGLELFPKKIVKQALKIRSMDDAQALFGTHYSHPMGRMITDDDVEQSNSNTAIYVISRQSGEGKDKTLEEFVLSKEEIKRIEFIANCYRNTIVVINSGTYFDISPIVNNSRIRAILFMSQIGVETGNALADVLLGKKSPSGHLTDTWVKKYDDIYNGMAFSSLTNPSGEQEYKEGIYVGYKYFDSFDVEPLYPFGYGLSYTKFEFTPLSIEKNKSVISLVVKVKNIGNHLGKAVPQVYLSCPNGKLDKPYQQLVAFEKSINLNPGDEEDITLSFDLKDEASYDSVKKHYVLEKGTYLVRLGEHSALSSVVATISIPMDIIVSKVNPIFEDLKPIEEINPKERKTPSWHKDLGLEIVDEVIITAKDITKSNFTPEFISHKAWEIVNSLELDELIDVVVGTGMTHFSYKNIFTLPGSVGNTTPRLLEKGITNIALCDGPAGLRLSRRSVLGKNKIKTLENVHDILNYLPKGLQKMLLGNEKKGQKLFQYATAFPVSNAMGQTWNKVCLELEGIAIAKEMIEFGCGYWLAPGMNIHRNPLCGRNFEYYSEDPHLTGALAKAIVKGVQSIDGAYATIKHYCCNNQEYLRNTSSSNLNERALREIYLKPFKMVIEGANAKAVMTCYNKVNGVYPSNYKPLIDGYLREECGFTGIVMTDWMATSKKFANPSKCIKAGNDMIMPGGGYDKKSIKKAYKKNIITLDELKLSAARIVDAINNSYRVKYDDPKQK